MLNPITAQILNSASGIRHGFFTRDGGVSSGIYASLNCGLGSGDERASVLENRRRVCQHLGGTPDGPAGGVVTLYQEHGATALTVAAPPDLATLPHADAVVSTTPGLVIGVLTADCAPVLLADAEAKVVGAAHAGWRGAVGGILEAVVAEMERQGAQRRRIRAAVGPCISQAAYEVGADFQDAVLARDAAAQAFFTAQGAAGKPHFDLPGYAARRLSRLGLAEIENLGLCTHGSESAFFSYRRTTQRREPDYGRQISAIVVA